VRADAERNRARILEVAFAAFAADGLGVSVHEIARRAGVGTGTVSRHFPTKNALIEAIIVDRAGSLMDLGRALREKHSDDPAAAFFGYFTTLVQEMAADRGLADALAGAGIDLEATVAGSGYDVTGMLSDLLARAQRAGAIRPDASLADVKALMSGCLYDDPTLPAARSAGSCSPGGAAPGSTTSASAAPGSAAPGSTTPDSVAPDAPSNVAPDAAANVARRRVEIVCAGLLAR
jgi:AcrR family transcriptional regulator